MQQITQPPSSPMTANVPSTNPLSLNDIHVPEQISSFPIAYGWWLLTAAILLLVVFIVINVRKKAKIKQQQKSALTQLFNSPSMSDNDVINLLKWAAMQYFPRIELAKIYGDDFQHYLMNKLPAKYQQQFSTLAADSFKQQYQSNTLKGNNESSLHEAAKLWLNHALPPIKSSNSELATVSTEEAKV